MHKRAMRLLAGVMAPALLISQVGPGFAGDASGLRLAQAQPQDRPERAPGCYKKGIRK